MSSDGNSENKDKINFPRGLLGRRGTPLASGTRLPSIKGPRDLTLGGVKKKTFSPNIPSRKEKSNCDSSKETTEQSKKPNKDRKQDSKNNRGKGRGKGRNFIKPELIQTAGSVFGDGPADRINKRGSWGSGVRETSSVTPGLNSATKFNARKSCKREDELTLKELLRDDFIDDEDNKSVDDYQPVTLPLNKLLNDVKSDETDFKPISEIKVEPSSDVQVDDTKKSVKLTYDKEDINLLNLFSNDKLSNSENLMLIKLPDCLPGFTPSDDSNVRQNAPASSSGSKGLAGDTCSLIDLPEGFLGKLQITKSGKTSLLLGNIALNIEMGTPVGFLEDLICVEENDNQPSDAADLTVLGNVTHRLICTPEVESLIY